MVLKLSLKDGTRGGQVKRRDNHLHRESYHKQKCRTGKGTFKVQRVKTREAVGHKE